MDRWKDWSERSENGLEPCMFQGIMSTDDIDHFHLEIKSLFKKFLASGQTHLGMQVYLDQVIRNDLGRTLEENPPYDDKSLIEWIKFLFGDLKFGIIHNYLENNGNSFSNRTALLIEDLVTLVGIPLGGISFSSSLENNGYSPLKVRKKSKGRDCYIFNLGPAPKQYFIWKYKDLTNPKSNQIDFIDLEEMTKSATKFELDAGDVLFIPSSTYYLSKAEELSLCLEMDYINLSKAKLDSQLSIELEEKDPRNDEIISPINSLAQSTDWNNLIDMAPIQVKLEIALRRKIYQLRSNIGIIKEAQFKRNSVTPNQDQYIKIKAPFPIFLDETSSEIDLVFARGNEFRLQKNPNLSDIISRLNIGESILIKTLQDRLCPPWELVNIYSFISDLYSVEAIEYITE